MHLLCVSVFTLEVSLPCVGVVEILTFNWLKNVDRQVYDKGMSRPEVLNVGVLGSGERAIL
jgi:hypothetical protein